jgi:hypothetical protein
MYIGVYQCYISVIFYVFRWINKKIHAIFKSFIVGCDGYEYILLLVCS